jgi:hypothetical protein
MRKRPTLLAGKPERKAAKPEGFEWLKTRKAIREPGGHASGPHRANAEAGRTTDDRRSLERVTSDDWTN